MNSKKVLIITYYWPPAGGAGVQRWLKFTKYLPESGIEPVILTVDPDAAEYPQRDESLLQEIFPSMEIHKTNCKSIYNFYKKFAKVKSAPYGGFVNEANPTFKQKLSRFIRGNFFLPDPRRGWNKYAYAEAVKLINLHGIKTIITTGPPHSTHLIGLKLKQQQANLHWIADFRDPWTDIYYNKQLYPTLPAKLLNRFYERSVLEQCDQVVTVSESVKELLTAKSSKGLAPKITVIYNGYDDTDFNNRQVEQENIFTITYTGTLGKLDLIPFIRTIEELSQKINLQFRFVGKLNDNVKKLAEESLGRNFEYIPYVPHEESIKYLLKSSIQLLVVEHSPNNKGIVTGKLFEYLGSGKPILLLGPTDGDAAKIIEECRQGAAFNYDDNEGVKAFLLNEFQHFKTSAEFLEPQERKKYTRKNLTRAIARLIENGERHK